MTHPQIVWRQILSFFMVNSSDQQDLNWMKDGRFFKQTLKFLCIHPKGGE